MIGDTHDVTIGSVAHGGHCVARVDGQVVFVRHALPGERVRIAITGESKRFLRADVVEVLEASPLRVEPPCPYAGVCGGCDFQHVSLPGQRELLGNVIREQLSHLAGIDWDGEVEAIDTTGLGWRTRVTFATTDDGTPGLRKHRSHEVVTIDRCRIAHPDLPDLLAARWKVKSVEGISSNMGHKLVVVEEPRDRLPRVTADGVVDAGGTRIRGRSSVTERVGDHEFRVSGSGFWQVHPAAATTLVGAVLDGAQASAGQRVADLYSGVGLFTAFLADAVGDGGTVFSVESDRDAVRDAKRNLHTYDAVQLVAEPVEKALTSTLEGEHVDVVVLDPPRSGAGRVVSLIAALEPARVVYVACDPAALGRDLATFAGLGYRLESLRAFDLFPMTHHVEAVAVLVRAVHVKE